MYERVHTVWDYFEGPRGGIADYAGAPHHYVNEYDEDKDDYTSKFFLRPIDRDTFAAIVKQWQIWREWELGFHNGTRDKSSHPALPGQDEDYAQRAIEIKTEIDSLTAKPIVATAEFRLRANQLPLPKGMLGDLEVAWTLCNPTDA